MSDLDDDERALRSSALQSGERILKARYRAEHELLAAKEALFEVAERLRLALSAGQLGDWSWDAESDEVTLGARAAETFDLPLDQTISWKKMRDLLHEDDRERARLAVEDCLLTRSDYDIEYRVIHRDGTMRWVSAKGRGVYGRDGTVRGMTGVVQDITERKRTEEALREESRMLELLNGTGKLVASSLELPVLVQAVTDAATELSGAEFGAFFYNTVNESGEAFLLYTLSGAPREAFEGFGNPRNTEVFGPTFAGQGIIRLDDVLADPRYGKLAPHYGMPKGHLPVRSYLAVPVIARDGSVIGGLFFGHSSTGVFTERTERLIAGVAAQAAVAIDNARLFEETRRIAQQREKIAAAERLARSEAERVSQMKDEFLATLSHELRTPLNAILGWSQLLLSRDAPAEARRGLETIARNARAQTQLIDDLLDMSRIISGKVRLDITQASLGDIVHAAFEAARPSAEVKEIKLRLTVDPASALVAGDPNRLQQVVWNLLTNAVKFTPKGGQVDVHVRPDGPHMALVVRDTGLGIDPAFLPHVFDRFRQADASSTRAHGGLGLGLSIVKQIVELHGGSAQAMSDGVGRGATFTVRVPLATMRAEDGDRPSVERPLCFQHDDVDLTGVRVLVVDDEQDARELVFLALTRCGAAVLLAASAREALDLLVRERPNVLVSDIGMAEADGYQLIAEVRALPKEQGGLTPAIALTAFVRSEDRTRAMIAGYQIHLSKPIEPRELVVTVGSLTGRMGRVASV